jgi:DNA-binding GntR family transcriptional regulator
MSPSSPLTAIAIDRRLPRAAQVYQSLREAILELRLKPGTPISENLVCEQFGVSRTPAREALIRLTHDELILVFPQHGSFVAPIRLKKVIEASFVREALESLILKLAGSIWNSAHTAAVAQIIERQRVHAAKDDHASFFNEDQNFHHYFAMVAGAEGMSAIINDATTHLVRIRRLTHPIAGRMPQAVRDHQNILDQISVGNVEAAVQGMTQHLSQVFRSFNLVAEQQPEYFQDFSGGVGEDIPEAMSRYLSSCVRPHETSSLIGTRLVRQAT